MCSKILSFIINIYPFTKNVSRIHYSIYTVLQILAAIKLWGINHEMTIWFILITFTIGLPVMVYRYRVVFNAKYYVCTLIFLVYVSMIPLALHLHYG